MQILYRGLAKELSRTLERQLSSNAESRAVGTAINPMGWVTDLGYEVILHLGSLITNHADFF